MTRSELSCATIGLVSLALFAGSCMSTLDPVQQLAAANRAVDQWVARHPTEWAVSLGGERTLYRPESSTSCSQGGKNNLVALTYESADTEINFHFTCPLGATAGVDDLQAAFAFAVLDRLPHGIETPGWRFHVRTPTSSVSDVVTFEATGSGGVSIRIDTPLYTVWGENLHPRCAGIADAPSAPGCYVFREHRIPLRMTLQARVDGSELE